MIRKKRTEITFETNVLIVRRTHQSRPIFCNTCLSSVFLVAPDTAATLAGVSTRTIYRWVELEQIHYTETPDGRLLVCPRSFPDCTAQKKR